jgi:hypothetical protein
MSETTALGRILAKHQLADILPHGVVCTCGAELAALNPPFDDGAVKGEPLALAVHQLQEMEATQGVMVEHLAAAWDQGRAAERRDWEFTVDLATPDEDRQPLANPYRSSSDLSGGV